MRLKHHRNLDQTHHHEQWASEPEELLGLVEREAALLGGHLRQAAALGRELKRAEGGLAVLRALAYASNSLRRMQDLLGRESRERRA